MKSEYTLLECHSAVNSIRINGHWPSQFFLNLLGLQIIWIEPELGRNLAQHS